MHLCNGGFGSGWRQIVNGAYITVWAGKDRDAPEQGLLSLEKMTLDGETTLERTCYQTPSQAGSIRVVAENNLRLTLTTTNNQQFVFDVATRQWVNP